MATAATEQPPASALSNNDQDDNVDGGNTATATATTNNSTISTVASVASAMSPSPPPRSSLLREWGPLHSESESNNSNNNSGNNNTMNSPPVAPAVVLNERRTSSNGTATTTSAPNGKYPVATFVSNLVRTSVNEIRDHIYASAIPAHAGGATPGSNNNNNNNTNNNVSIRSEPPPMIATLSAATLSSGGARSLNHLFAVDDDIRLRSPTNNINNNNNANSNSDAHSTEFLLIDGDLVAIPAPDERDEDDYLAEQQHLDYYDETELEQQPPSCRPRTSRVRRGVKGFKKWIKKVKRKRDKHYQHQHQHQHEPTASLQEFDSFRGNNDSSFSDPPTSVSFVEPPTATSSAIVTVPEAISPTEATAIVTSVGASTSTVPTAAAAAAPLQPQLQHVMSERSFDSIGALPAMPPVAAVASLPKPEAQRKTPPRGKKELSKRKKRFSFLRDVESWHNTSDRKAAAVVLPKKPSAAASASAARATSLSAPTPPPTDDLMPASLLHHRPRSSLTLDEATASLETTDRLAYGAVAALPHAFDSHRMSSGIVGEASFIGNADQLLEAGVVLTETAVAAEAYIEDRLDDYDKYDKKMEGYYPYYSNSRSDYKVDKQDAPCVDTMLTRAGEFAEDLVEPVDAPLPMPLKARGKSDGSSVPLSEATSQDLHVHNDMLKVVMVGAPTVNKAGLARAIRQSTKKSRKRKNMGVDVHEWAPEQDKQQEQPRFSIWDVQGASTASDGPNFGAHPGTQSLFFSDKSLYLLVWDLAANNPKTHRRAFSGNSNDDNSSSSSSDEEDDDDDDNDYICEERNRQADRALRSDIEDRVLSWVDCVARRGPNSAFLPIGLVPAGMSPNEAKRRCDIMGQLLLDYTEKFSTGIAPKVLMGAETMICVSLDTDMGIDLLRETIVAIATDSNHSVFDHVGTPVPKGTVHVLETTRRLKQDHKLVLVDHLMAELHTMLTVEEVMTSLHFLTSIGELFYYGGDEDVLSRYVILSRKWLVSALSCILRNDLKRELAETRRFMNMQCLYSNQQFPENHVTQTFSSHSSSCPLLSSTDTQMLWQSMSFMREAVDRSSELRENSTTESTIFGFLERLLVQSGVFLPIDINDPFQTHDCVYFVPSLLSQAGSKDVWTYKSSDSWMTTLSHSWLFRDGAPAGLMEHVTVCLLHDLYEFSRTVSSRPLDQHQHGNHNRLPARSSTFPFAQNSLMDFVNTHDGEPIGNIKIHQIMCWKSSIMVKIGCMFPDGDSLRESFVEIFITIADQSSPHCVASDIMRPSMQRLIVSGKGQVGHHGVKLWKGGYSIVLDSIKASLANYTNVDRQVVCPECLAHAHPSGASTWSWDSVRAAATSGSSTIRCMRGHRVDANMVCGTCRPVLSEVHGGSQSITKKSIRELLPAVVVVALWDADTQCFNNVGSGFVVDRKHGLIVTAGHVLFNMTSGQDFGTPHCDSRNSKIAIGFIPKQATDDENNEKNTAKFRYFAELVADDVHSVDACVLKITTRMENDVESGGQIADQIESLVDFQKEELPVMKMTRRYELEEAVRILGFNQGGEGLLEQGKHVNRSADFARGYICKQFRMSDEHSTNSSDESSSSIGGFAPREEIVVMCPTISGHSGGPCVNDEGRVVGILSRGDPVDRQRCYLVPASEIKILLSQAKQVINRGIGSTRNL